MRRVVLAVAGSILILLGLGAAAVAGYAWSAIGSSGEIEYDLGQVRADEPLLLIDLDRLAVSIPYLRDVGEVRLGARAAGARELHLSAAPTASVDEYVDSTAYAVAYRDSDTWRVTHVPGPTVQVAQVAKPTWLASATGTRPAIVIPDVRPITIVLSTDGPLQDVELLAVFTWPQARQWTVAITIIAAVLVIAGIALVVLGLLWRRTPDEEPVGG